MLVERRRAARVTSRLRPLLARLTGPTEVTCELFDGQHLRVALPELEAIDLYRHGLIEPPVTAMLLDRLRPGMAFFDVGAHYGYFTVLASRLVGPTGTVVAFEPSRSAARLLTQNVNHLDRVVVEHVAVQAETGTALLSDFGPRHSALNTVLDGARVPARERRRLRKNVYEVPAVSLDDYTATHNLRPAIVKLDAEGAELAILTGMRDVLRSASPLVVLETGDYQGMAAPATSECIDVLETMGYRPFEYDNGLRPHDRRDSYGYGNLFFSRSIR